jgi:hypothetical protein
MGGESLYRTQQHAMYGRSIRDEFTLPAKSRSFEIDFEGWRERG